jgi:hypothetical protein
MWFKALNSVGERNSLSISGEGNSLSASLPRWRDRTSGHLGCGTVFEGGSILVGRDGVLCVYQMRDGSCEFARFAGSLPFSVLYAIEEEFKTEVVNHHDYRYWGFGSEQEIETMRANLRCSTAFREKRPGCYSK